MWKVLGGTLLCLLGVFGVMDMWRGGEKLRLGLEYVRRWWKLFVV